MKIMLDVSPKRLAEVSKKYDYEFWQLQTPISRRRIVTSYALDNGCFANFKEDVWLKQVQWAKDNKADNFPTFVTLPDMVGDARRTSELFNYYMCICAGLPRALVLQDGISNVHIEWKWISAVFVGGSDAFKISPEAMAACKTAKMLGKWVHVGRVNTAARLANWVGIADSIDGSGLCKYDKMLDDVMRLIKCEDEQLSLISADL